jgi:hypothetical protein
MTRVLLDAALRSKLHNLSEPVELCDESGRVVGRVIPIPEVAEEGPFEPQISEEEIKRRINSDEKRYTTAEVLAYLERL